MSQINLIAKTTLKNVKPHIDKLHTVTKMKHKYLEHWTHICMLYAFAFILDPGAKVNGFHNALSLLTGSVNVEYDSYFTEVRDKLPEVYGKYVQKYAGVWQQQPPPAPIATKKREAWKNN
jgi:hypothetical protein